MEFQNAIRLILVKIVYSRVETVLTDHVTKRLENVHLGVSLGYKGTDVIQVSIDRYLAYY